MESLRNPTPDRRAPLTDDECRARRLAGHLPDYAAWEDLRRRMPLLIEEAHLALECDSEMRGEFGMGYVCGGGSAGDAGLAYSMGLTDHERDFVARAQARVDLSMPWHAPEFFPVGHDFGADVPF